MLERSLCVDQLLFDHLIPTPKTWLEQALMHLPELLNDHAACEKKAAQFAMSLTHQLIDHPDILKAAMQIAREELRHYEQVIVWMQRKKIRPQIISSSRYAAGLHLTRPENIPELFHKLLVAAVIEARSCERFLKLTDYLSPHPDLQSFYQKLWQAEKRHALVYLEWAARLFPNSDQASILKHLIDKDASLCSEKDTVFRFHSGPL